MGVKGSVSIPPFPWETTSTGSGQGLVSGPTKGPARTPHEAGNRLDRTRLPVGQPPSRHPGPGPTYGVTPDPERVTFAPGSSPFLPFISLWMDSTIARVFVRTCRIRPAQTATGRVWGHHPPGSLVPAAEGTTTTPGRTTSRRQRGYSVGQGPMLCPPRVQSPGRGVQCELFPVLPRDYQSVHL